MKPKIYIIGASGFIGSHLKKFLQHTTPVISVGRVMCDVEFDLSCDDPAIIFQLLIPGDYLIFLASISSPEICNNEADYARMVNVKNTAKVISAATQKGANVIFASSDAVFGSSKRLFDDCDAPCPSSNYGEMKAAIEEEFKANPFVKIVRLSYVIGPGDKFTDMLRANAMSESCVDVFKGFERSIVSLYDVVQGIQILINNWDGIQFSMINFSGPNKVSREYIAELFCEKVFPSLNYKVIEAPLGFWDSRTQIIYTSCKNFTSLLGRPPVDINHIVDNWDTKS